jgi:hypothetical protein
LRNVRKQSAPSGGWAAHDPGLRALAPEPGGRARFLRLLDPLPGVLARLLFTHDQFLGVPDQFLLAFGQFPAPIAHVLLLRAHWVVGFDQ